MTYIKTLHSGKKNVQLDILTLSLSRYDWSSLDRRVNQMVKTENFLLLPPEHIVFIKGQLLRLKLAGPL